jgi:CubicO group peptidase (beta-lactamase class C family)
MNNKIFPLILIGIALNSSFKSGREILSADVKGLSERDYTKAIHFTEKSIYQLMHKQHLPGFTITIVDEKGIIYQKAFGLSDIENNIPASTKTVFKIWSVAKVFTAIEIFREVEQDLIDLDLPITRYLPEFNIQSRYNNTGVITVKSILAHRSGLPRNECVNLPDTNRNVHFLDRFERSITDCFMAYPVGYRYKYSNLGYDLLGRIIEENRRESYSKFMREILLNDLGMKNSSFSTANLPDHGLIATGYEYYKGKYFPMIQSDINSVPSGNFYSTIEDLSIFLKTVINNEVFSSKETMSLMYTDYYSNKADPERMGLGWKTTKLHGSNLMAWHDGGPTEGTGALVAVLPESKLGVALIANGTSFSGSISVPFAMEIFDQILETKSDSKYSQSEKPGKIDVSSKVLSNYEGNYTTFGQIMSVRIKKNKLKGKIGRIGLDLIPVSETKFRVTHWMDKIGLTKIIKPPIDFKKIGIEFYGCTSPDSGYMIINLDNISYEICSRYPENISYPINWNILAGEYQIAERLANNEIGKFTGRHLNIRNDDDILIMSGVYGPIVPLTKKYLTFSSGSFAGEVIEFNEVTGNLIHQNFVFVPTQKK